MQGDRLGSWNPMAGTLSASLGSLIALTQPWPMNTAMYQGVGLWVPALTWQEIDHVTPRHHHHHWVRSYRMKAEWIYNWGGKWNKIEKMVELKRIFKMTHSTSLASYVRKPRPREGMCLSRIIKLVSTRARTRSQTPNSQVSALPMAQSGESPGLDMALSSDS